MDLAVEIEKSRPALLRIVGCWLFVARGLRCAQRALPARVSNFILELLRKLEIATGYLMIAAGGANFTTKELNVDQNGLVLDVVIARLRAIQAALKSIRGCAVRPRIMRPNHHMRVVRKSVSIIANRCAPGDVSAFSSVSSRRAFLPP